MTGGLLVSVACAGLQALQARTDCIGYGSHELSLSTEGRGKGLLGVVRDSACASRASSYNSGAAFPAPPLTH